MLFSIIVPVYNVEQYLRKCVESIQEQSCQEYELILVDDGSTDSSGKICDDLSNRDSHIKVYHKKNGGLSDARNYGLKYASGKYVIFLDSDDYWEGKNALKNIKSRIEESNCDVLVFNHCKLYEKNRKIVVNIDIARNDIFNKNPEEALEYMIKKNVWKPAAWNKVILFELLKDNHIEFEMGRLHEDLLWCCQVMLYAKKFDYYEKPVYIYRQRKSSITKTIGEQNIKDINSQLNQCIRLADYYDNRMKKIIYSYCAYDYSILTGYVGLLSREKRKKYYELLKDKKWLLDYKLCEKVKKVALLQKAVGYKYMSYLLTLFLRYKK